MPHYCCWCCWRRDILKRITWSCHGFWSRSCGSTQVPLNLRCCFWFTWIGLLCLDSLNPTLCLISLFNYRTEPNEIQNLWLKCYVPNDNSILWTCATNYLNSKLRLIRKNQPTKHWWPHTHTCSHSSTATLICVIPTRLIPSCTCQYLLVADPLLKTSPQVC